MIDADRFYLKTVNLGNGLTFTRNDDRTVDIAHDCDCCKGRPQPCCKTVVDLGTLIMALDTLGFRIPPKEARPSPDSPP